MLGFLGLCSPLGRLHAFFIQDHFLCPDSNVALENIGVVLSCPQLLVFVVSVLDGSVTNINIPIFLSAYTFIFTSNDLGSIKIEH